MSDALLTPLGPLFGPNFISIQQNDDTGKLFTLEVYPDANNNRLKPNGMPLHFYFVPREVFLAKKMTAPADFDFAMTVFKGLLTGEITLGITDDVTAGGAVETGGSFCTFSTTFAIPESVIRGAIKQLRQHENLAPNQPDPELGMVPIVENNVTIEVPDLVHVGAGKMPFFINAQGTGRGSLEANGISTFLVTCNELAAGAIAGALKKGKSPFTVHYNLKQQFYISACDVIVTVDVDKVYQSFSSALSAGGFLGIDSLSFSSAYESTVTSGGISTQVTMNGAVVDADTKKMIETQVEDMRKFAMDLVKHEIFDFTPAPDTPASTQRSWFSSIFGGFSVSMKSNYQKRAVKLTQTLKLNESIAVFDTKSGDLNDLEPAIRTDLDKYLAEIDIGDFFRKVQVAATTNVEWADGALAADPINSIQLEVGYPDFTRPLGDGGKANPQFRGEGFHYLTGHKDQLRPAELIRWDNQENGKEIVNVAFLKLTEPMPDWDVDEVVLRKTIVFNPGDPRVELASGGSVFVSEVKTKAHAPVITPDEVGCVRVHFSLGKTLPAAIGMILTCKIGTRTDTIAVPKGTQGTIAWEIYSDKYIGETAASWEVEITASGPAFTDDDVVYKSPAPVPLALPTGRSKYVTCQLTLPSAPADKVETINRYIKAGAVPA